MLIGPNWVQWAVISLHLKWCTVIKSIWVKFYTNHDEIRWCLWSLNATVDPKAIRNSPFPSQRPIFPHRLRLTVTHPYIWSITCACSRNWISVFFRTFSHTLECSHCLLQFVWACVCAGECLQFCSGSVWSKSRPLLLASIFCPPLYLLTVIIYLLIN
jgi:hypothetical protein